VAGTGTDVFAALRACRLWRAASDEGVRGLAGSARMRHFPEGARIAAEGEPAGSLAVVAEGTVVVYHLGADGRRMTIENWGPGQPALAVAALSGGRYPANADAETAVRLVWLPREALFDLMAEEPAVARDIVTELASRIMRLTGTLQMLSLDVPARLAGYLFQRALAGARQTAVGLQVELGMSKGDLARVLGTVPETLSRALARLRAEGLLETRGRVVLIRDVGGLARRGAGYTEG